MKPFLLAGLLVLTAAPWASAQFVVGPPVFAPRPVFVAPPIAPVVSYSYYPPAPVAAAPVVVQSSPVYPAPFYPAPVTSYYGPAPTMPYAASTTTTYGLGIFRPRAVTTTQYYYGPYVR